MAEKKTALIDLDGVINTYSKGWQGPGVFEDPLPRGVELLNWARSKGYRIVIFTARKELGAIRKWLKNYDIEVDEVTNTKQPAAFYVDDRGLHFDPKRSLADMVEEIQGIVSKESKQPAPKPTAKKSSRIFRKMKG